MPEPKVPGHKGSCSGKVEDRIRRDPETEQYYKMQRCACGALVLTRGDYFPDYASALASPLRGSNQ